MLSNKRINELTKLFKKHIQAPEDEKAAIEKEMKRYGCSNSAQAFKKIREYRRNIK
ncbi:hypothetical protein [Clostridium felsineum]|uniref:Uncharacterized protein n=1 Tax=Clostridium felsineum TaxID=36839 RepID=A0A1S8LRE0_9CLOT|nr:hypothetical protein [Clostridium felsineum]URZ05874.1 hypothetical protein CLROS_012060 [Clostridium felsineum]URZ10911.1 hypothetical protein CROST_016270 [Clostridium felsineum]